MVCNSYIQCLDMVRQLSEGTIKRDPNVPLIKAESPVERAERLKRLVRKPGDAIREAVGRFPVRQEVCLGGPEQYDDDIQSLAVDSVINSSGEIVDTASKISDTEE